MRLIHVICGLAAAVSLGGSALAQSAPVGEARRVTQQPGATLRNADHSADLRITVWYPAVAGTPQQTIEIGPPGRPFVVTGAAAANAPIDGPARRPVVLLSHGFGGTARMMGWFGTALAQDGYVVIAVDHPGNNGADPMTVGGAVLWSERPEDLRAALAAVAADPVIGPHLDLARVGAAGFSAGGFTALAAAGAAIDSARLEQFCKAHPQDGVCRPQIEFTLTPAMVAEARKDPAFEAAMGRVSGDHSIPAVRAAFAISPALVQAFDPASLRALNKPVLIIQGDADTVAEPATNAQVAAALIPGAKLEMLPKVGHYAFLGVCTPAGKAEASLCKLVGDQEMPHARALAAARAFFAANLR